MKRGIAFILLLTVFTFTSAIYAQDSCNCNELIADLTARIETLEAQVETLSSGTPGLSSTPLTYAAPDVDFTDGNIDGNYIVKISKYAIAQNRNGEDVLVVYYTLINPSSETSNFYNLSKTIYQNGIELSENYYSDSNGKDMDLDCNVKVRSNATYECFISYLLFDTENPVEVEITDKFNYDKNKDTILYVLDLSQAQEYN